MTRLILAALCALCALPAQGQSWAPDAMGLLVHSHHIGGNRDRLTDSTPGIAARWNAPLLPWSGGAVDVLVFRNSQGRPGAMALAGKEWRVAGPLFVGAAAGVAYGYRPEVMRPVTTGLCLYGPGCAPERGLGAPGWSPAADLRARVVLGDGYSVGLSYLPARTLGKVFNSSRAKDNADALSLILSKEF